MKTINVKEKDGVEYIFNPRYVKSVKIVHSEYNNDWCIVLNLDRSNDSVAGSTYTILCNSEKERDEKMVEIREALESI